MFRTAPRVKICCIACHGEAELAVRHGASALGLVSEMPSGPGPIAETEIREIAQRVPPGIATFLLTCRTTAEDIARQQRYCGTNTLQLVDAVNEDTHQTLRTELPGIRVVQVIHVQDERAIDEALRVERNVDAILLDSGNPAAKVKELGGTGRRHNWAISRAIRDAVSVPIYLAGGLNALNVGDAIAQVEPFGVDVCSGLRTNGNLDERKVEAFMTAVLSSV